MRLLVLEPKPSDHLVPDTELKDLPSLIRFSNPQPIEVTLSIPELVLIGHVEDSKLFPAR